MSNPTLSSDAVREQLGALLRAYRVRRPRSRAEIVRERLIAGVRPGELRVDDELHLSPIVADEEDPELMKLRAALDRRIGEAELPEIILGVDAQVRFSWIMLGREPRSASELLMVYAGILAHGTALSAAETARMIPQLGAQAVRHAMRWASDERRLAEAYRNVLSFMHRHSICATWGRSDLASSDMMSLETAKRVWQARLDPRRQTPSIGIYSHVRDRWGVFHAQPHQFPRGRRAHPIKQLRASRRNSSGKIPACYRMLLHGNQGDPIEEIDLPADARYPASMAPLVEAAPGHECAHTSAFGRDLPVLHAAGGCMKRLRCRYRECRCRPP